MSDFAISGLSSGIDTDGIVKAIIAAERLPQQSIKNKIGAHEKEIKALQGVNSKAATLATVAENLASADSWNAVKATSSSDSVSVSAGNSASVGTLRFDVLQLAQQHSEATDVMHWEEGVTEPTATRLELLANDGPPASVLGQIAVDNADPRAIAMAVNSGGMGFTAQAIQVAPNQYRLQLVRTDSSDAFSFNIDTTPPTVSTTLQTAQPAIIRLDSGMQIESTTNTFSDLTDGLDLTVTEVDNGVTIDVAQDAEDITSKTKSLVEAVNSVLSEVKTVTYVSVGNDDATGKLVGSSLMRNLAMQTTSAATGYAGSGAAYEAGITVTRFGELEFDEAKFAELLSSDPEKAQSIVGDLASRVQAVAETFSDSSTGSISQAIKSKESDIDGMNDQVDAWDRRIEMKRATLVRQFTAMETAMAQIQGQANWLASQLPGLSANS